MIFFNCISLILHSVIYYKEKLIKNQLSMLNLTKMKFYNNISLYKKKFKDIVAGHLKRLNKEYSCMVRFDLLQLLDFVIQEIKQLLY